MYLFVLSLCERTFGSWAEERNLIHNRWIGTQLGFGTAVQNSLSCEGRVYTWWLHSSFFSAFMFASSVCKAGGERLIPLYFFYSEIRITMGNMSTPDNKYILIFSINEHHLPSSTFSQNQLAAKILQYCFLKTSFMFIVIFFFFFF